MSRRRETPDEHQLRYYRECAEREDTRRNAHVTVGQLEAAIDEVVSAMGGSAIEHKDAIADAFRKLKEALRYV